MKCSSFQYDLRKLFNGKICNARWGEGNGVRLTNIFLANDRDIKDNEKHPHIWHSSMRSMCTRGSSATQQTLCYIKPHIYWRYHLMIMLYDCTRTTCVVPLAKMAHIITSHTIQTHTTAFKWMRSENVAAEKIILNCIQFISIKCTHVPHSFTTVHHYPLGADLHFGFSFVGASRDSVGEKGRETEWEGK